MKGIIRVKLITVGQQGDSKNSIWMFEHQIEHHPTLRDWITYIETELLHLPSVGNVKLEKLRQIDTETFSAHGDLCIPHSKDDSTYYQSLIQD